MKYYLIPETNGHLDLPDAPKTNIPRSLGSDEEAVAWVNEGIKMAFDDDEVSDELIKLWFRALTQYTKSSGQEVGTLLIVKCLNPR